MPLILLVYLHPPEVNAEIFPKEQYKLCCSSSTPYYICSGFSYLIIP